MKSEIRIEPTKNKTGFVVYNDTTGFNTTVSKEEDLFVRIGGGHKFPILHYDGIFNMVVDHTLNLWSNDVLCQLMPAKFKAIYDEHGGIPSKMRQWMRSKLSLYYRKPVGEAYRKYIKANMSEFELRVARRFYSVLGPANACRIKTENIEWLNENYSYEAFFENNYVVYEACKKKKFPVHNDRSMVTLKNLPSGLPLYVINSLSDILYLSPIIGRTKLNILSRFSHQHFSIETLEFLAQYSNDELKKKIKSVQKVFNLPHDFRKRELIDLCSWSLRHAYKHKSIEKAVGISNTIYQTRLKLSSPAW